MSQWFTPTPGPWKADQSDNGPLMIVAPDGMAVAAVNGTEQGEANAALICAAPDMMAAVLVNNLAAARAALISRGLA